jgi:long-chain acyl-CoA synthetase
VTSPFVWEWLAAHARDRPRAPALDTPAVRLDYGTLHERVLALALALARQGVTDGDRVLIALSGSPAAVVASLAAQRLGACAVELNRELGESALAGVAEQTGARHALIQGRDARLWGKLATAFRHLWVVHPVSPPPAMLAALRGTPVSHLAEDATPAGAIPAEGELPSPNRDPSRPALLVYTSGSTGAPRAVIQTHDNVDANTRSIVEYLGLSPSDRAMAILPLYYCYGKSVLQTHLFVGGSVFLDDRFLYPLLVMESMAAERCTGFAGVPLTFELIRKRVDPGSLRFPDLRYVTQAGGPMHPGTIAWARRAFAPARLFVMYGQTEATARLSFLPPERAEDKKGSIGIAIPGVELGLVDDAAMPAASGVVGHLVARGRNVTPGYFRAEEETRAILKDGWLWTGDLAYRDADGFLFLTGRSKEILKIGGHRVSPLEIEQVLETHPAVDGAAVVGVPDAVLEQAAAAFVVFKPGASSSEAELRRYCRERLPAFKVPRSIQQLEALPRSATGKLLKTELQGRLSGDPSRTASEAG